MDAFIGTILLWPADWVPMSWAKCEGQALAIKDYEELFSIIGLKYGGDGGTNFKLPDLRQAVPANSQSSYIIALEGIYPQRD